MVATYRVNAPLDIAGLKAICEASGLRRPVDDRGCLTTMADHANLTVTARERETLVGTARALTDFAFYCCLSDVGVAKGCQRKGTGRAMVERMRCHVGEEVMTLPLSGEGAMRYDPKIGFEKVEDAWKIPRGR